MTDRLHIMAIGAHAADMEFTAGAILLLHTQAGHRATLVHLTLGGRGHPTLSEPAYTEQKRAEAEIAARRLGAELEILPYVDGDLPASEEAKLRVADLIRARRPTHIITHWQNSIHKDHRTAFQIAREAMFYASLPSIVRENPAWNAAGPYLAENWEDTPGYTPQIYFDTTLVYDRWIEAAKSYELFRGGVSGFDYCRYYEALATLRGTEAGFRYAETLSLDHPLGVYISGTFDQMLQLRTSNSPIFQPQLQSGKVG
jgi:LmbE family N-acetylglucosaminyl deacetylase